MRAARCVDTLSATPTNHRLLGFTARHSSSQFYTLPLDLLPLTVSSVSTDGEKEAHRADRQEGWQTQNLPETISLVYYYHYYTDTVPALEGVA